MFKYLWITFILLTAVLASGKAYCQQDIKDLQLMTVSGAVARVELDGSFINVKTEKGKMTFYMRSESNLSRLSHHISILEIHKGDLVRIEYVRASGKNEIITLVDKTED